MGDSWFYLLIGVSIWVIAIYGIPKIVYSSVKLARYAWLEAEVLFRSQQGVCDEERSRKEERTSEGFSEESGSEA